MIVLVIGGAGYIGSHAARTLKRRGHEVVIYDNLSTGHAFLAEGFELIVGQIADTSKLAPIMGRVDAVMHFAGHAYVGESVENPRKYGALEYLSRLRGAKVHLFLHLRGVRSAVENPYY